MKKKHYQEKTLENRSTSTLGTKHLKNYFLVFLQIAVGTLLRGVW